MNNSDNRSPLLNRSGVKGLRLNLQPTGEPLTEESQRESQPRLETDQSSNAERMLSLLQDKMKSRPGLENEKRILALVNSIDKEVVMLDNRMDVQLEQHEKDFLAAYRKHMIAVQKELTDLKNKGTETELQLKQDKKIAHLEKQINQYKEDCTNIMKYCRLQQKVLTQLKTEQRALADDDTFLGEQINESKIDTYNLKVKLADIHNQCKEQNNQNVLVQDELQNLIQQSEEYHVGQEATQTAMLKSMSE